MEHLNQGNSFFVDEQYDEALEAYNKACEAMPTNAEAFVKRSQCNQKLSNHTEALSDINEAIKIDSNNSKSYLKKGQICFELEEYEVALKAFEKGSSLEPESNVYKTWIRKAKAEIEASQPVKSTPTPTPAPATATTTPTPAPTTTPKPTPTPTPATVQTTPAEPTKPQLPIPSSGSKVRHEWYQTATHVIITIFAKFVTAQNSKINVTSKSILVSFNMANGSEFIYEIDFFDPVTEAETLIQYYNTKVEIKLKKSRSIRWDNLEYTEKAGPVAAVDVPTTTSVISPYASKKNWDKLDVEEDKSGDPLNNVFKDIFARGTDEQKKAMMKSFTESGGTVLSTNWDEVGQKKVEISPPKGMEAKKYEI
ncbi:hypothetical protein CYY_010436 [Polysphondylium violaceum]|uniref:TPR repeat-containing protein n=1 Tax=Polysphondylium violaceum TaxID=133409 RepID=A0A8J4PK50_9MYCE|nr:hypothetical protein CYY_010436 [Polysphondylium violaceum]